MKLENKPQTNPLTKEVRRSLGLPQPEIDTPPKRKPDRKADIKSKFPVVWMSDKDVAAYTGVSRNRVWAWVRMGRLPKPIKLGPNTSRWHIDDILQWTEKQREASAS